jgi:hypothetical protein
LGPAQATQGGEIREREEKGEQNRREKEKEKGNPTY